MLDDQIDEVENNFTLYISTKKGKPKDDFPALSLNSSVRKLTYDRFCLCCFTHAFVPRAKYVPALRESINVSHNST